MAAAWSLNCTANGIQMGQFDFSFFIKYFSLCRRARISTLPRRPMNVSNIFLWTCSNGVIVRKSIFGQISLECFATRPDFFVFMFDLCSVNRSCNFLLVSPTYMCNGFTNTLVTRLGTKHSSYAHSVMPSAQQQSRWARVHSQILLIRPPWRTGPWFFNTVELSLMDYNSILLGPHRGTQTEAMRSSSFSFFNRTQSFCLLSSVSKPFVTKHRFVMYVVCIVKVLYCTVNMSRPASGRHDTGL